MKSSKERKPQIVILWMERAIDGSAAGSHLRGTLARLESLDVALVRTIADTSSPDGNEGWLSKLARIARVTFTGIASARPGRVLIARFHPLMLPLLLGWKIARGRVILSVQGTLDSAGDNLYPRLGRLAAYRRMAAFVGRLSDGLIVGAPTIEDHVRTEMLGKHARLMTIPNGIFTSEFQTSDEPSPEIQGPYAVFVGNLAKWQGVDILAQAVTHPSWPTGLPLVVIGDGSERPHIENVPGIIWLGRLPSNEARRWLRHAAFAFSIQRSDIAVAKHGYWPFKLIESAAAGVPIVCSDAPGLEAAAERLGNAVVVPAQDPPATAAAAARLWRDPELRQELSMSGLKNARAFDWAAGSEKLNTLIQAVQR